MFKFKSLIITIITLSIIAISFFILSNKSYFSTITKTGRTIGIIVPLQHNALNEIVKGIKKTLKPILSTEDKVIVMNANGDQTLQNQIIRQMLDNDVDYFMPIGTSTSLMTISIVKTKPIISVAGEFDYSRLKKVDQSRVSIVNDNIQINYILQIIKTHIPKIKKVGFIYSNSEKIFPEIESAKEFCQKNNLGIALRKVDNIAEIYQFAESVITEVDAIILLKDNMVISGITGIAKLANKHRKPLITLDNGSILGGAHFAFGVDEEYIGIMSAETLIAVMNGNKKNIYKAITMTDFSIFYNTESIKNQDIVSPQDLQKIADSLSYELVPITQYQQ